MINPSIKARYFMLYEFNLGHHPEEYAVRSINYALKNEETIDLRTCQYWFRRFRNGNSSMEDNPDPKIIWNRFLPDVILYDILSCLDRQEIEKCCLLNKRFDNIIEKKLTFLSIRFINPVKISDNELELINDDSYKCYSLSSIDFEDPFIKSLPECIIGQLNQNLSIQQEEEPFLETFYKKFQRPLRMLSFDCSNITLELLVDFLTKYIITRKVEVQAYHEIFPSIIQCYQMLQFPSTLEELNICSFSCDDLCTEQEVKEFLINLPNAHIYTFKFLCTSTSDFFNKLIKQSIEIFQENNNNFVKSIQLLVYECTGFNWNFQSLLNFFAQKRIQLNEEEKDENKIYTGTVQKKMDWKMDIRLELLSNSNDDSIYCNILLFVDKL